MSKELWIFSFLLLVRWKISALYPVMVSNLLEWGFFFMVMLLGIAYSIRQLTKYHTVTAVDNDNTFHNTIAQTYRGIQPYTESISGLFLPLLLIFLCRSFVFDTNYIISGSMEPTLQVGDITLIQKYRYGLRIPFTKTRLVAFGKPQRGDIITFSPPKSSSTIFIKRVIGLPGDKIQYQKNQFIVNGQPIPRHLVGTMENKNVQPVNATLHYQENIAQRTYSIHNFLIKPKEPSQAFSWQVPQGHYFMIGDNRDNSLDSRYWGFLPEECLVGQASYIIFSINQQASWKTPWNWIRWGRIGAQAT